MKKFEVKDINLIIDCFNDLPSNINDYLAFISYFSFFEQFKETLKPLIVVPKNKLSNITFWASSFQIPVIKKQINFEDVIQRPAFRVKCGVVLLDQNFDYQNSYHGFENNGIQLYSGEEIITDNVGLIGKLDDEFSSSFINLNQDIYFKDLVNILYGVLKDASKIYGKVNRVLLDKLLIKAYKIFVNFPQAR